MKKLVLLICLFILILGVVFAADGGYSRNANYRIKHSISEVDTINTDMIKWSARTTTVSNSAAGAQNLLDSVKTFPASSCILLSHLDGAKWLLEKHPGAAALSAHKVKSVTLLDGDIKIMGVRYTERYAIILK